MSVRGRWWIFLVLLCLGGATPTSQPVPSFPPINDPSLPNAHIVNPKVICGGLPEGDAGFEKLAAMGVKTVISVDGMAPDVEAARRHGIRYIHLPFGYDTLPQSRGEEIAKAIAELPGPIYVHCHHGQHRAPTAVAVACVMNGMLPPDQAETVLRQFGTGANYVGLWQSARDARRLNPGVLKSLKVDFVPTAPLPPLAEAMVTVDERMDHLKELQKAGWRPPPNHPDLDSPHEALQLDELLREIARSRETAEKSEDFRFKLTEAEVSAAALDEATKKKDYAASNSAMMRLAASCTNCHKTYRDRPGGRGSGRAEADSENRARREPRPPF
jgi:protein tyrosine phosphatase (PTP) superfamily phosphohydrolase (DUF442 family)